MQTRVTGTAHGTADVQAYAVSAYPDEHVHAHAHDRAKGSCRNPDGFPGHADANMRKNLPLTANASLTELYCSTHKPARNLLETPSPMRPQQACQDLGASSLSLCSTIFCQGTRALYDTFPFMGAHIRRSIENVPDSCMHACMIMHAYMHACAVCESARNPCTHATQHTTPRARTPDQNKHNTNATGSTYLHRGYEGVPDTDTDTDTDTGTDTNTDTDIAHNSMRAGGLGFRGRGFKK